MIYFNTNDFNITKIKDASKLRTAITKEDFRIYGLRQSGNSPILLEYYEYSDVADKLQIKFEELKCFFKTNNVEVDISTFNNENTEDMPDFKVYIGLRRDIRHNIELSAAILKTIVYYIDDKITLDSDYKVGNIPKFKTI